MKGLVEVDESGATTRQGVFSGGDVVLGPWNVVQAVKDAKKVALLATQSKSAVVIGGGILGLEAAWELTKKQVKVTVVEMAPRIMPRQIGAETSDRLTEIASIHGIEIMTHATVKGILGVEHVTAVELEGDIRIPADMVVISCGIKAITAQAVEA